jgi:LuxR family transcriptional regulator, quorum-sensing system regulator BjaR1
LTSAPSKGGRKLKDNNINNLLTNRQLECLTWSAAGKSSFEIGQILDISERGVNWHINNAMKALGTVTRIQAVARGVHLGLIQVE